MDAMTAAADDLDDPRPLEASLGYLFRDTHRLIGRQLQDRLDRAGVGLGVGQWYLLRALWAEDGLTQRELSARIGMGEPNAVTALRGLEAAGIVTRETDAADSRRKRVSLTPEGHAMRRRLTQIADEINANIAAPLSAAEADTLRSLIRRVRASLGA